MEEGERPARALAAPALNEARPRCSLRPADGWPVDCEPDHIHMTGVATGQETCVSLHLYGRNMSSFHIYDVAAGTRRLIEVPHQESR